MTENQEVVESKEKNFFAKWIGVYFTPSETFESIDRKPDWFLPLLILAIITIIFALFVPQDVSIEAMMDRGMTEDQAYEMMESPWVKATSIFGGVAVFIVSFILAGIFYLVFNFMMGGDSSYKKVLSVYSYTGFALGVVGILVKLPLIMAKGSVDVQTSPAAFLSADMKEQFLYKFLSKFDIFVVWQMILLIIGFGVLCKFSRGKSAAGVLTLWGIYIIVSILLSNLFSSFGG